MALDIQDSVLDTQATVFRLRHTSHSVKTHSRTRHTVEAHPRPHAHQTHSVKPHCVHAASESLPNALTNRPSANQWTNAPWPTRLRAM
jgi:hypothetical protein